MHFDFIFPVLYSADDLTLFGNIAAALRRNNATVALLTHSREGFSRLTAEHPNVFYLYDGWEPSHLPSLDEVRAVETKYGIDNLADFVYPEQVYWNRPTEALIRRAVHTFAYLERFLEKHSVGVATAFPGGGLTVRALERLAIARRLRYVRIDYAPFHGRMSLTTENGRLDEVPARPPALSTSEREFAESLVSRATRERKMFSPVASVAPKRANVLWMLRHAGLPFSDEQVDWSFVHAVKNRARRLARRSVVWSMFQQPSDEPYVFFPLHVPGDTAVTVRAAQYENQGAFVEFLARRAMPSGLKLFVKPHPAAFDEFSLPMLLRLKRLPGVRLIDPAVNSHEMISKARACVVLTSTVGFEALLYNKPVVVLGKVFYRGYGLTADVENAGDLPAVLAHAIKTPPDREAVLRFVHACHSATYPGDFYDFSPASFETLARAFQAKAARLGLTSGVAAVTLDGTAT